MESVFLVFICIVVGLIVARRYGALHALFSVWIVAAVAHLTAVLLGGAHFLSGIPYPALHGTFAVATFTVFRGKAAVPWDTLHVLSVVTFAVYIAPPWYLVPGDIERVMADEHLYVNPDLTLVDVAMRIRTTANHVSQAVNQTRGMGFRDYLAALRIAEFKRRDDAGPSFCVL